MGKGESGMANEKGNESCAVSRRSTMSAGACSIGRARLGAPADAVEARRLDFDGGLGACRGDVKSTAIDGKELGAEMLGD